MFLSNLLLVIAVTIMSVALLQRPCINKEAANPPAINVMCKVQFPFLPSMIGLSKPTPLPF